MDRPAPEVYQPRLGWTDYLWRILLMLTISVGLLALVVERQTDLQRLLDVTVGLVAMVLVLFRRRRPLLVALACGALSVASAACGPALWATVSVATRRRWREILPVAAVMTVAGVAWTYVQPYPEAEALWVEVLLNAVITVAVIAIGMYVGSRRELVWTLRQRAERAEAEQELRVGQARTAERARIAREMHDVLAHRISQISMHAGALAYRKDLDADALRGGAAEIRERAHEALDDLRGVLGVLRAPIEADQVGSNAPQPTYADLLTLVEQARTAGLRVEYDERLPADPEVPVSTGRTLYRIVQEGITNARKHAPGSLLRITVTGSPEAGISFALRNPAGFRATDTPGAGLGLVGLAERVELAGGRVQVSRPAGTFLLSGWLPWPT